jgi:hypothetical protein
MAVLTATMTDEHRKSVGLEYLKASDKAGRTSTGGSILGRYPCLSAGGTSPATPLG